MAIDTFIAYVGVYDSVADAEAGYQAVKDLHTREGLIDAYDAAVIERRADGNVKIAKKHETPTRAGGVLGAGVGLAKGPGQGAEGRHRRHRSRRRVRTSEAGASRLNVTPPIRTHCCSLTPEAPAVTGPAAARPVTGAAPG